VRAAAARLSVDAHDDERAAQLACWHADAQRAADLRADGWDDTAGDDAEWGAECDEAEAVAS
jgi:hypothetical protein